MSRVGLEVDIEEAGTVVTVAATRGAIQGQGWVMFGLTAVIRLR